MKGIGKWLVVCGMVLLSSPIAAQSALKTSGIMVIVPAEGEVRHANDEARAIFLAEERDKDHAAAASRVNLKMKQGTEIIRREDPRAKLKTYGYYTYPVYAEDQPRVTGSKAREPVSWRVGQYLEVTTVNLTGLPKTVASAQKILALNSLQFGLSEASLKLLDEQRIAVSYRNLEQRIAAIAKAMGRPIAEAVIETLDFEASGSYLPQPAGMRMNAMADVAESAKVEQPNFEPGETTLPMRVVAKVRFK